MSRSIFSLLFCLFLLYSCNKWLDVGTAGAEGGTDAFFESDAAATAGMRGIYEGAMQELGLLHGEVSRVCTEYGGEIRWQGPPGDEEKLCRGQVDERSRFLAPMWQSGYHCIVRCNAFLDMLERSPGVSAGLRAMLQGEARLLRAVCYFYLAVLFDHIPLVLGAAPPETAQVGQVPAAVVFAQVLKDLEAAAVLLPAVHPHSFADSLHHTRAERGAAHALLARVHLYLHDDAQAAYYASLVIGSGLYALSEDLAATFQRNSPEVIFQLRPVNGRFLTSEGNLFQREYQGNAMYALSPMILQAFEPGDGRALHWTQPKQAGAASHAYAYKYRISASQPRTEYNVLCRLAELYLIRAEARARLGAVGDALADLGTLRLRAGVGPVGATSMEGTLRLVTQERRAELFCEWGFHWLDLKRWAGLPTGDVLQQYAQRLLAQRPGWRMHQLHFPLPRVELDKNRNLVQNAGY